MRGATLRDILLIVFVPGCLAVGTEDSAATLPSALLAVAASSCRFRWLQRATGQEEDDVSKLESKLRDKEINSVEDLRTIEDAGLWESFFMALGEGFLIMSKLRVALRKKPRHNPPDVGSSTSEVQAAGEQAPAVTPASSSQADATMAQEDQEMAAPLPQEDQQMAQEVHPAAAAPAPPSAQQQASSIPASTGTVSSAVSSATTCAGATTQDIGARTKDVDVVRAKLGIHTLTYRYIVFFGSVW